MTKVLITGIEGFVGRSLASLMREKGYEVFGTCRSVSDEPNTLVCDISNKDKIDEAIRTLSPEIVIHLAALSSVTDGTSLQYYETNVIGTENVMSGIDALNQRVRFIYVSTAGVYGNQNVSVLSETLPPLPVSHYGISKFAAERLVLGEFSRRHDVSIVRPFNIVGPGQKSGFIFPKLVRHFRNREAVIRLGNLDPVRDYIDIYSCCRYICALIENRESIGQIVNLCSGQGTSVRQLLDCLTELTRHHIEVEVAPEFVRANEVWSLLGDASKLNFLCPIVFENKMPIKLVLEKMLQSD